jgi:hypothetical protein
MIASYQNIPFAIPFRFSSVDDDTRNAVEVLVPYNVAVYAITMAVSVAPNTAFYHANIQFLNYHNGQVLFDEPLSNLCFQADARTPWMLPSKWYIKKNEKIICTLDSADDVTSATYYITLLGYVTDVDPNPGVQPFAYSYPITIGFQDNVAGTTTALGFNQAMTGTMAKHMLHDFDLHAIVLDPFGGSPDGGGLTDDIPTMSLQVSTQRRKLFDRFVIDGVAGGGTVFSQGDIIGWMAASSSASAYGFPNQAVLQYKFPQPIRVCKRELVRVDLAPAPTYLATDLIHSSLSQRATMALIGNHIAS